MLRTWCSGMGRVLRGAGAEQAVVSGDGGLLSLGRGSVGTGRPYVLCRNTHTHLPALHELVHVRVHKLENHKELVVLPHHLLQLDNVWVMQLLERLPAGGEGGEGRGEGRGEQ